MDKVLSLLPTIIAHSPASEIAEEITEVDLEQVVANFSMRTVGLAFLIVMLIIAITVVMKKESERTKVILFSGIAATVLLSTVILIGSTIYLNTISSSKGPVHWHADTEIWACGKEIDIKDPVGRFSNKIGTNTLHEHNDKRIHLEGVVVETKDASLGKFFRVIGGGLTHDSLVLPTNDGDISYISGQDCNGETAELQVFAFKANDDKTYSQSKLADPADYVITGHSNVPPGDCIIIEFDRARDKTDRLCRSYKVANEIGRLKGEVDGN